MKVPEARNFRDFLIPRTGIKSCYTLHVEAMIEEEKESPC